MLFIYLLIYLNVFPNYGGHCLTLLQSDPKLKFILKHAYFAFLIEFHNNG